MPLRMTSKASSPRKADSIHIGRVRMVPGGRVELPTPAFSGPRSTGELPRHRGEQTFYAKRSLGKRERGRKERFVSVGTLVVGCPKENVKSRSKNEGKGGCIFPASNCAAGYPSAFF